MARNNDYELEVMAVTLMMHLRDLITDTMTAQNVTRSQLARRMGVTSAQVTAMLKGGHNMTVRTLAEALFALDSTIVCTVVPLTIRASAKQTAAS